ncbi:MAG: hypothetical protein CMH49_09185 [Myxococcales bacterium]|nr:hypothetical protein [Myxococcales bacterium]
MTTFAMAIWLLFTMFFVACEEAPDNNSSTIGPLYRDQAISNDLPDSTDGGVLNDSNQDSDVNPDQDLDDSGVNTNDSSLPSDQTVSDNQDMDPSPDQDVPVPTPIVPNSLSVSYSNTYLLDNFQSRDPEYLSMNRLSIQNNPAFYGNIRERDLPDTGEANVIYEVFGLQAPEVGLIAVLQMSFDATTNLPVNPFIQLSLNVDLIDPGQSYEISSDQRLSRLMVFDVNPDLSINCVRSLGFGSADIPNASNLTLIEGGSIDIYGQNIPLYQPGETPVGDIRDLLLAEGKNVCSTNGDEEEPIDATSLIVNEIDYASPGLDQGEFVEIYNPTNAPIELNNVSIEFVRSDLSVYQSVNLQDIATTLAPGEYLVLGDEIIYNELSNDVLSYRLRDPIQNGGVGNGVRLTFAGASFEEIGYGGLNLNEGTCSVNDDDRRDGFPLSIGRCGQDTNNNAEDFVTLSSPTPGYVNNCP